MKDVLLINGSPRGKLATSFVFLKDLEKYLDAEGFQTTTHSIGIRPDKPTPAYILTALSKADAVVFSFPLYAYTTPAAFTKFLEDYCVFQREHAESGVQTTGAHKSSGKDSSKHNSGAAPAGPERPAEKTPKIYAFVNCGYAAPDTNREALRVMRHFCRRTGMEWRFGVSAGGGLIVAMTRNIPIVNAKLRRAYKKITADIGGKGEPKGGADIYIKPVIPKAVMIRMKDSKWAKRYMAKNQTPGV